MENVTEPTQIMKASSIILAGMMKSEKYKHWTSDRMIAESIALAKQLANGIKDEGFRTK